MSLEDLNVLINTDAFRHFEQFKDEDGMQELCRRLTALVEKLLIMFSQLGGDRIVNMNVTYNSVELAPEKEGITVTLAAFDAAGNTIPVVVKDGLITG